MSIDAPPQLEEPSAPPPPPARTRGPITLIVVVGLVLIAIAIVAFVRTGDDSSEADGDRNALGWHGGILEGAKPRPSFTLTDSTGQPYDFAAATSGQLTFLFFGYTHCPDICPITMANLTSALDQLPGTSARVVFITTDPSRDTPERLKDWLGGFPVDVVGLTGSVAELEAAQKAAGVSTAIAEAPDDKGEYTVGHSASVLVYTPDDQQHMVYSSSTMQAEWMDDIPRIAADPGWNAVDGVVATGAYAGPSTAGQSAVYLTVVNGGTDNAVVGVTSPDAPGATLHVTSNDGTTMSGTDSLDVPSGGAAVLSPAGDHVMLSGLSRDLVEGDTVTVVLELRSGAQLTVVASVVSYEALAARIPSPDAVEGATR
ncbi:MAG TPA: SCO family protein [Acidimicrobiales bacterium]